MAGLCRAVLGSDPFSGGVFVFGNKSRKAIKILVYDGQGFWLCQKRLSKGRFPWWPRNVSAATQTLAAHQLTVLLPDDPDWRQTTFTLAGRDHLRQVKISAANPREYGVLLKPGGAA